MSKALIHCFGEMRELNLALFLDRELILSLVLVRRRLILSLVLVRRIKSLTTTTCHAKTLTTLTQDSKGNCRKHLD